jgi:two-component system, LytTR family, response regulator
VRVILVDDEPLSLRRLHQLLNALPEIEIVAQCTSGRQAIAAIGELKPDVVFLDVQMPEVNGFEVVAAVSRAEMPLIVFVTAYDEYAVRAFDVLALDYIMKPVAPERLRLACERASAALTSKERRAARQESVGGLLQQLEQDGRMRESAAKTNRLLVRADDRIVMLKTDDINWVEAAGNYVRIHVGKDTYMIRETIGRLETILDPGRFARIHRSTVINLDSVKEMQPWFSGEMLVIMNDGTQLKLSRTYRRQFEQHNRILS